MNERKPRNWPSITGSQQERATEAFRRLEDMTRLISDWVWEVGADGKLTYVSERIIDRLGVHPVQVVGGYLQDFGAFETADGSPADPPDMRRSFRDLGFVASGMDGKERQFVVSGLPRYDAESGAFVGSTGIARDVSELVRAERTNVRLADAIDVLSEYFVLYDENDELVISNARFRQFNRDFGDAAKPGGRFLDLLRREVLSGRYPEAKANSEKWIQDRLARRAGGSAPFEQQLDDGRWLFVDDQRLPDGGTVTMSRDITEMKRAMQALRANAERQSAFAADVAHRLRTPLAVMRASLDAMGDDEHVVALRLEIDSLARMIEQLLTLTRYENFFLEKGSEADLHQIAVDVIASMAPIAIKDDRQLLLEGVDHSIPMHGEAGALEYAVRNLIDNAVRYSSRGSEVRIYLEDDPPLIRVSDQGVGIPIEKRSQLFEKFYRTDRRGAGAGLGLNIVKVIADAHDAEVTVGENTDGGAVFTLKFPTFHVRKKTASAV